jgi:DNA-binding XRE family transcriptional regulator
MKAVAMDYRSIITDADRKLSLQRKLGRLAGEKKKFRILVEKLGKLTSEQGYTKKQIASELGVSLTTVYQWSTGYTLTARPETIERLKKFLVG